MDSAEHPENIDVLDIYGEVYADYFNFHCGKCKSHVIPHIIDPDGDIPKMKFVCEECDANAEYKIGEALLGDGWRTSRNTAA